VAATLANTGSCPLSGVECFKPSTIKNLLSRMYSCGMGPYAGKWDFSVGIPAVASSNGLLMIIIPNVMGMVIYQPSVNKDGLSPRAEAFCRQLTLNYRVNLFDQLVFRNEDIAVSQRTPMNVEESAETRALRWFELCFACSAGDTEKVSDLLHLGVDINMVDYDDRSALHIAASDGHLGICKMLMDYGADPGMKDRWGHTPADDAQAKSHTDTAKFFTLPAVASYYSVTDGARKPLAPSASEPVLALSPRASPHRRQKPVLSSSSGSLNSLLVSNSNLK
jgi:glutaminase